MNLLPQDVLVMLALVLDRSDAWTYEHLAHDLGMSSSMVHSAVKRSTRARLYDPVRKRPLRQALEEFLVHGVKYAYPPDVGGPTRGVATAWAVPALRSRIAGDDEERYVWPSPQGETRGIGLSPLYRSVPDIAWRNKQLYNALGLLDAIRIGRARERVLAEELLMDLLRHA